MLDYAKNTNPRKYPTRLSIPRLASNTPTEAEINKYLSEVKEFDKAKVEYAKNLAAHQEAEAERIR